MALRSNLRTPLEEDPGNGKHRNGDEAEKARCPAGTQLLVHCSSVSNCIEIGRHNTYFGW